MPDGLEVDFVRASSYQGTESSSTVTLHVPSSLAVTGRHVLLVCSPLQSQPPSKPEQEARQISGLCLLKGLRCDCLAACL